MVIGTGPSGQGHETSFAQVVGAAARRFRSNIDIIMGDTDVVSLGGGSRSGRSMRHSATLFAMAAPELIAQGKAVAARLLEADAAEVEFADGRFSAPRTNRSFDFLELAREGARLGAEGKIAVTTDNEMHDPVFPNGCAVCEVEVDPETGMVEIARYSVVDDVGRCINPLIVHGQTHGGAAQGVGQAMWEECAIDPASGQPLSGSFLDYGMPRSDDLPSFATRIVEVLSPTNPFGIKAGGEGGTTPALAVVISAILDALAPLGVRDLAMRPPRSRCGRRSRGRRNDPSDRREEFLSLGDIGRDYSRIGRACAVVPRPEVSAPRFDHPASGRGCIRLAIASCSRDSAALVANYRPDLGREKSLRPPLVPIAAPSSKRAPEVTLARSSPRSAVETGRIDLPMASGSGAPGPYSSPALIRVNKTG